MRAILLAATALAALSGTARAQDLAAGEQSFRKCFACHRIGPEARHLVGPSLNGLEGRKSGTMEGYNYSPANKAAEIVWSETAFHDYIQNPTAKVPGTKMAFPGIKDETEIKNLWAYLRQFNADGSKKAN